MNKETVSVFWMDANGKNYIMHIPKEELEKGLEMNWHFTPDDLELIEKELK